MRKLHSLLFLLLTVTACSDRNPSVDLQFTNPDGKSSPPIHAEVVSSGSEKQLGLMYRKSLDADAGMLFVFRDEQPRTFWMKNTYLELDMIFLDRELKVVSMVKRAVPLTETGRESKKAAQYVLEVRGGSAESWSLTEGSQASVRGEIPAAQD